MIKGILGKKVGMSQLFRPDGEWIPVTLIKTGPCCVIQKKVRDVDGYDAVQLGFEPKKESGVTRPQMSHQKKAGNGFFRYLREVDCDDMSAVNLGDEIKAGDVFERGERIKITGTSKGKGFAGTVKRHGFGGLPASHGSKIHRATGSIGCSADPSKVIKGKRMPGHMGNARVTVKGLEVVDIIEDDSVVVIRGAVPGANGRLVVLKK
ncbi:MAG: 50S ribosomal protein L3 [Thermodesulfobacteriota bacterium]|nr:50S ribosomal protein L3 [Thermodesulfobacteriota bacterium]